MRKIFLALAMLLCLASPAVADPLALAPGEVLRGRFVQERFLAGFDRPARSEGSFLLAPGKGLIWRGETPFPIVTVITPAGVVQSIDGRETLRISAAKVPFLAHLHEMMSGAIAGDWLALEQDFVVARDGETVTLTPRHPGTAGAPAKITARVHKLVERVEVDKPGNDRDILTFSNQAVSRAVLSGEESGLFQAASR
jgi:hypothetical protein